MIFKGKTLDIADEKTPLGDLKLRNKSKIIVMGRSQSDDVMDERAGAVQVVKKKAKKITTSKGILSTFLEENDLF